MDISNLVGHRVIDHVGCLKLWRVGRNDRGAEGHPGSGKVLRDQSSVAGRAVPPGGGQGRGSHRLSLGGATEEGVAAPGVSVCFTQDRSLKRKWRGSQEPPRHPTQSAAHFAPFRQSAAAAATRQTQTQQTRTDQNHRSGLRRRDGGRGIVVGYGDRARRAAVVAGEDGRRHRTALAANRGHGQGVKIAAANVLAQQEGIGDRSRVAGHAAVSSTQSLRDVVVKNRAGEGRRAQRARQRREKAEVRGQRQRADCRHIRRSLVARPEGAHDGRAGEAHVGGERDHNIVQRAQARIEPIEVERGSPAQPGEREIMKLRHGNGIGRGRRDKSSNECGCASLDERVHTKSPGKKIV